MSEESSKNAVKGSDGTQRARRVFRVARYRGLVMEQLLALDVDQLSKILKSRARRKLKRGLTTASVNLIRKLRKAKEAVRPGEKPQPVLTHLRDMIVLPEMVGGVVGIHNGKTFNICELKAEMIGMPLSEFSITYKQVKHGRPGVGATHSSRFIPLK